MTSQQFQTTRARIAFIQLAGQSDDDFRALFDRAGYLIAPVRGPLPVDIAVVDVRDTTLTASRASVIGDMVRKTSPEATLLFILDRDSLPSDAIALKRFGEVIPADHHIDHLIPRIQKIFRIRNIAEEAGERLKTLSAINRAVDFPVISTDASPPRVLIIGTPGPVAIASINAVSSVADICACVLTPGQAMRALDHQTFDVALFLPADQNGAMTALVRALRRHPKNGRIALLHVIASGSTMPTLAGCGGADFILDTQISANLPQKIQTAARRARLIHSMREFLAACAGEGVRDSLTGIFTPTFLGQHGARLVSRSAQTQRPLSLVVARLAGKDQNGGIPNSNAMQKAAMLFGRITRAEDMAARLSRDTFLIVLPATAAQDAERIALRIDGVLSNTSFYRDADGRPASMHIDVGVQEHEAGAAISESVARALATLPQAERARRSQPQSPQLDLPHGAPL